MEQQCQSGSGYLVVVSIVPWATGEYVERWVVTISLENWCEPRYWAFVLCVINFWLGSETIWHSDVTCPMPIPSHWTGQANCTPVSLCLWDTPTSCPTYWACETETTLGIGIKTILPWWGLLSYAYSNKLDGWGKLSHIPNFCCWGIHGVHHWGGWWVGGAVIALSFSPATPTILCPPFSSSAFWDRTPLQHSSLSCWPPTWKHLTSIPESKMEQSAVKARTSWSGIASSMRVSWLWTLSLRRYPYFSSIEYAPELVIGVAHQSPIGLSFVVLSISSVHVGLILSLGDGFRSNFNPLVLLQSLHLLLGFERTFIFLLNLDCGLCQPTP